ncbi:MAG: hypothetical protein ACFFCS_20190 [Candidatus Hodarchaeota archaeon]
MTSLEGFKKELALDKKMLVKGVGFGFLLSMFLVQLFTSFFRSFFYTLYPIIHNTVFAGEFVILPAQIIYLNILFDGGFAVGFLIHLVTKQRNHVVQNIKAIAWLAIVILSAITPFLFTVNESIFNSITAIIFLISLVLLSLELRDISMTVERAAGVRAIVGIGTSTGGILTYITLWLVLVTSTFPYFMVAIFSSAGMLLLGIENPPSEFEERSLEQTALDKPNIAFFKSTILLLVGCFVGFPTIFSNYSILNFEVLFAKLTLENTMLVVSIAALLLWLLFTLKPLDRFNRLIIIIITGVGSLGCSYLLKESFGPIIALFGGGVVIAGILMFAMELVIDKVMRYNRLRSAYIVLLLSSILLMFGLGVNYAKFAFLLLIPEFQTNDFSTNINLDADLYIKLPFVLVAIALWGIAFLIALAKKRKLVVLATRMEGNPNLEKREKI